MVGTVLKDNPDDLKKMQQYFEHVVKKRSGKQWKQIYDDARHELDICRAIANPAWPVPLLGSSGRLYASQRAASPCFLVRHHSPRSGEAAAGDGAGSTGTVRPPPC